MSVPSATEKSSSISSHAIDDPQYKEPIAEFAERLLDPEFDGGERVGLAVAIRKLDIDQRPSICSLADRLNLSDMDDIEQALMVQAVAALKMNVREVLVEQARLHEGQLKAGDRILLLECLGSNALSGIELHKKTKAVLDALPLLSRQMMPHERDSLLNAVKAKPEGERGRLVALTKQLAPSPSSLPDLLSMLEAVSQLDPENRQSVTDAALPFLNRKIGSNQRVKVLQTLSNLKPDVRDRVASAADKLQFLKTESFHPVSMIQLLLCPAIKRLESAERERLLKATHFLFHSDMNEASRILICSRLLKIPPRDLDHVAQYVARAMHLVRTDLSELIEAIQDTHQDHRHDVVNRASAFFTPSMTNRQRASLIKTISKILPEDRDSALSHAKQILGSEMNGVAIAGMIEAVAHLKPAEREAAVAIAKALYSEDRDWEKRLLFVETLGHEEIGDLPLELKIKISQHALELLPPLFSPSKALSLLRIFKQIPIDEMADVVALTKSLMDPALLRPESELLNRIEILNLVGELNAEQRATAIGLARTLFVPGMWGIIKAQIFVAIGKCPSDKRGEIVQQILSQYTPQMSESQRLLIVQMFSAIHDVQTEDRVSLVQQACSLFTPDMTQEAKLEILDLFAEVAHLSEPDRLSAVQNALLLTSDLEFDVHIHILHALENIPLEEREDVVHRSLALLTSKMKGEDIRRILMAIGEIPVAERSDTIRYARFLFSGNMGGQDRALILNQLMAIPLEERGHVVQNALTIIADGMTAQDRCKLIETIAWIAPARRSETMEQAKTLFVPHMTVEDQCWLIEVIDAFPLEQQATIIEHARGLFTPEMNLDDQVSILEGVGAIRAEERALVIQLAAPHFTPVFSSDRGSVLKALGATHPDDRLSVIQMTQAICPPGVNHKERADIIEVIKNTPLADRESLIGHAAPVFREDDMSSRSSILRALRWVPMAERASVIEQANRIVTPGMSHSQYAILLAAVSEIPAPVRQEIVEQLLPLFIQGVSVNARASLLLFFAELPAAERINWVEALQGLQPRMRRAGVQGQFLINLDELAQHSIQALERLYQKIKIERKFPTIKYENSEGIDQGGLTRDFVTRLFQALCNAEAPKLSLKATDLGFIPTVDPGKPLDSQCKSFQAIGAIFSYALRNHQSILVGKHFAPVFFEMLHALSDRDLAPLSNQTSLLQDAPIPEPLYRKLLKIYLKSQYPHLFGGPQNPQLEARIEAFVEQGTMPPQLEGYDRDEFLEECQIRQVFGATLLIAKSIQDFLEGKTSLDAVKGESAVHLAKKIQGSISKEQVIESLLWEGGHEETQAFLLHWIQGATDDQVAHFAWAITGSMTLHESQRLTIHLYNDPDKLPTFHTCSHTMDLPTGYGSQAKFNEKLELALSSAQGGMQVA